MKRQLLIVLVATMLAFAGGSAVAQSDSSDNGASNNANKSGDGTYQKMDADKDGQISEDEFRAYYDEAGIFDTWDVNDDEWIDDEEFADGLWDYYDEDDDGFISDAEWENGIMVDDYGDNGFWDM